MTDHAGTHGVTVDYRDGSPAVIRLTGWHRDGEYKRKAEYRFSVEGSSAVLTNISPNEGTYQVQHSANEREAVAETVENLPFVQAVVLFDDE